jgi:hypothetical protein
MALGWYEVVNSYTDKGKVIVEKPVFVCEKREGFSNEKADHYFDYFEDEESAWVYYNETKRA